MTLKNTHRREIIHIISNGTIGNTKENTKKRQERNIKCKGRGKGIKMKRMH